MLKAELFENRRLVAKKICHDIRVNGGLMTKAKYFSERPHCDGAKTYKFSMANFLRLLSSDDEVIRKSDPRWFPADEIENNGWTVCEGAESELLEVWTKDSDQQCFLTEFYNAADILEQEPFKAKNESLETVLEFLQVRGLLELDNNLISLQDGIEAIKKYAENLGADELTSILTIQTWVTQTKLKTKLNLFLPTYSESILAQIEKSPDMLFESMSKAQAILKQLRREKIVPTTKDAVTEPFGDLKIIYHGSNFALQDKVGVTYPEESVLTGSSAYDFLFDLKSAKVQKIWLELSYKDYAHGKILLSEEDYEFIDDESISAFLRKRLNQNRQYLLDNPQNLRQYITSGTSIRIDEMLAQIKLESNHFLSVMADFTQEEFSYLESQHVF